MGKFLLTLITYIKRFFPFSRHNRQPIKAEQNIYDFLRWHSVLTTTSSPQIHLNSHHVRNICKQKVCIFHCGKMCNSEMLCNHADTNSHIHQIQANQDSGDFAPPEIVLLMRFLFYFILQMVLCWYRRCPERVEMCFTFDGDLKKIYFAFTADLGTNTLHRI